MSVTLLVGDCIDRLRELPDESVHCCVTDPPYHLTTGKKGGTGPASLNLDSPAGRARISTGFMGKAWDGGDIAFRPDVWREVLRVLKPGGHLLAFGGTRTYHRLACAIEDAGFEIRDQVAWTYGSGFPKSHDVAKAIEATNLTGGSSTVAMRRTAMGDEYEPYSGAGHFRDGTTTTKNAPNPKGAAFTATTDAARQWQGWGTALKPAWEPICLARKPLIGTVAANVTEHGTGAINVDGCRAASEGETTQGRWPANLIHDGSDEVLACFPEAPGQIANASSSEGRKTQNVYGAMRRGNHEASAQKRYTDAGGTNFAPLPGARRNDSGSAARFFYCAKASRKDRDDGLAGFEEKPLLWSAGTKNPGSFQSEGTKKAARNNHPTVKPTELMRYLCRLVTPPGGVVLDPFMGSGSTGRGAWLEGFDFIGIELDEDYARIAKARINAVRFAGLEDVL